MKMLKVMCCVLMGACLLAGPVYAEEMSNYELTERLRQLEEKLTGSDDWTRRITISGVIEAEYGYEKIDFDDPAADDEDGSDLSLATVEVGVDVEIADNVGGHVLFLYEDGEDLLVDEGFIEIGSGGEDTIFYVKAGEMYVPFGAFESHMISDPLTLEVGETRETAVEIGFESNGFSGALYAFNGDIDEDGEDSHVDNFGARIGYMMESDDFTLDVGVSYINNIADSDGLGDLIDETAAGAEELGVAFAFRDYVPGIGVHGILSFGPVTLIGEYVGALEEPEWNVSDIDPGSMALLGLDPVEEGDEVKTFNLEAAYTCEMGGKETVFAVAYQGSEDLEDFLPEKRYIASVGIGIFDGTSLAFEYLHDTFENDDEADVFTAQLAIEF